MYIYIYIVVIKRLCSFYFDVEIELRDRFCELSRLSHRRSSDTSRYPAVQKQKLLSSAAATISNLQVTNSNSNNDNDNNSNSNNNSNYT